MKNNHSVLKQLIAKLTGVIAICVLLAGCEKDKVENDVTVITGTGDITSKLNEFRQVLGPQLNTTPGAVGGHREVNWDGVPPELLNKPLPGNFFNTIGTSVPPTRQRGLVYSSGIDNFQVSNDGFVSVNASTAAAFAPFSGSQIFANVGSDLWKVDFQVPGEALPATVKGFGLVFSDVDKPNSTFIEFFNGTESIGKYFAPVHDASSNFSFLGVYFKNQKVTHIRVGHDGSLAEGGADVSAGGQKDFVVFDDFLFDEPVRQ
jgi:hypothetical protein